MGKITQKMVRAVKAHNKQNWHDKEWWTFESKEETSRIQTAISFCGKGATIKEIADEANKK